MILSYWTEFPCRSSDSSQIYPQPLFISRSRNLRLELNMEHDMPKRELTRSLRKAQQWVKRWLRRVR